MEASVHTTMYWGLDAIYSKLCCHMNGNVSTSMYRGPAWYYWSPAMLSSTNCNVLGPL